MEKAIVVKDVYKKYKLYENSKERLLDLIRPDKYGEEFYALSGVNFEAEMGEVVGFIGTNGSGKSTLSNIISGIVPETTGSVIVNGDVALIAVSAGLKGDLSGRENIELKLLMLGFNKKEIEALEPDIIEFAELEQFIDQPVKSYSSGMKSRLGFAISVNVDPEILIIDEALSVGDKAFAEKSLNKMKEFKSEGKTMIFVSHSIGQMKKFCDKILWLEFGRVKEYGTTDEVIPKYETFLEAWKKMSKSERKVYKDNALLNNINKTEKLINKKTKQTIKDHLDNQYEELPTSRLGKLKSKSSYVYSTPRDLTKHKTSQKYKDIVYYVKKQANVNGERFYLISEEPSAIRGVIGWIKASDIKVRRHIFIDTDPKSFKVIGTRMAYAKPWRNANEVLIANLDEYAGNEFNVVRTERTGKTFWYYGDLDGQMVWISEKELQAIK